MLEYLKAHPEIVVLILTIILAIVKRSALMTPEQYAALPPRFAAGLKLAAALLPDVVKAVQVAPQVVSGKPDPTKVPVVVDTKGGAS